MNGKPWTMKDIKFLQDNASHGSDYVAHAQRRTVTAVRTKASALGIRFTASPVTCQDCGREFDSRAALSQHNRHSGHNGTTQPSAKGEPWEASDDEFLLKYAGRGNAWLAEKMERSPLGIVERGTTLGVDVRIPIVIDDEALADKKFDETLRAMLHTPPHHHTAEGDGGGIAPSGLTKPLLEPEVVIAPVADEYRAELVDWLSRIVRNGGPLGAPALARLAELAKGTK